jgi:predicted RecA/RadA family phage recombinase
MADAVLYQDGEMIDYTPVAAVLAGEIVQIYDGRAAVAPTAIAAGVKGSVYVKGVFKVLKTASELHVPGHRIMWDESASTATCAPSITAGDFFIGCAVQDAAAADSTTLVDLNSDPLGTIDQRRDSFASVPVLTSGDPRVTRVGGYDRFILDATNEAQKIDALSHRPVALASDWIFFADVCVDAAEAGATDISIGVADGTHATDFQSVATLCTIHIDGASQNILVQSDDGSTDVAPIDSTIDYVDATPFNVVIDGRNPADIVILINGIRETAAATTLALAAAASGLKACVHIEKTSSTDTAVVQVGNMKVTTQDI